MAINPNSIVENILVTLQRIPSEQQRQILDYVEFIAEKYADEPDSPEQSLKKRVLGLHQGKIWMGDDFNDPLSDDFWGFETFRF